MEARAGGLDGTPQVVLGLGMRTRKAWTALLQHFLAGIQFALGDLKANTKRSDRSRDR